MIKYRLGSWKRFGKKKSNILLFNSKRIKHEYSKSVESENVEVLVAPNEAAPKMDLGTQQGPIIRQRKEKVQIQVGLDFGTSSTKVAYSVHGTRGTQIIEFNHDLPHFPKYCFPSIGAVDRQGRLLLGAKAAQYLHADEWDTGFHRIKVLVAGDRDKQFRDPITEEKFNDYRDKCGYDPSFTPARLSAIFLAYTMVLIREILKRRSDFKEAELDLAFNICMPIDYLENNRVRTEFEGIFAWAESMYRSIEGDINDYDLVDISEKYRQYTDFGSDSRVFGIPESVAQIASYLVSLRKKPGIHAVIDVGSGTTDISIFDLSLYGGEGDKSYWYAARNLSRGTAHIERRLYQYLKENQYQNICSQTRMMEFIFGLNKIIDQPKYRGLKDIMKNEVAWILGGDEYRHIFWGAYQHCVSQKAWANVEIFKSGGGSQLPNIDEFLAMPWIQGSFLDNRYRISDIPASEQYHFGKNEIPFRRLAVAYGLAIPKPRLNEFVLPLDCPNLTPAPLPVWKYDRDEIYAK